MRIHCHQYSKEVMYLSHPEISMQNTEVLLCLATDIGSPSTAKTIATLFRHSPRLLQSSQQLLTHRCDLLFHLMLVILTSVEIACFVLQDIFVFHSYSRCCFI
ncbi:hypothetical protein BDW59DRAFT_148625 [Aspergillus cavernicola]|uniref:Uncharacterized protein n=1 Tax=Aspergillus cavernicola TaxID=176166 RepID=A0ABR4I6R4_9EURO